MNEGGRRGCGVDGSGGERDMGARRGGVDMRAMRMRLCWRGRYGINEIGAMGFDDETTTQDWLYMSGCSWVVVCTGVDAFTAPRHDTKI